MSEKNLHLYYWYVSGFCFARVKPADKVITPSNTSAEYAAAFALGVHDGGKTAGPRSLGEIRKEAGALAAE